MTPNDSRGKRILDICLSEGINVPSEVAVLGMGNDDVMCETSIPPLSSIDIYAKTTGRIAAETLQKLLMGSLKRKSLALGYALVYPRTSTDTRQLSDKMVSRILEYVDANINGDLRIDTLSTIFNMSRRTLETRVRKALGHSIGVEIENSKIEHAKALLRTSDRTISDIATHCGFHDASHFILRFRLATGGTPTDFRRT